MVAGVAAAVVGFVSTPVFVIVISALRPSDLVAILLLFSIPIVWIVITAPMRRFSAVRVGFALGLTVFIVGMVVGVIPFGIGVAH